MAYFETTSYYPYDKCMCKVPNKETYKSLKKNMDTAKLEMDKAKSMIETKKAIFETAKARVYPTVKLDIPCCTNSNLCTIGNDCDRFVENCELKINLMSLKEKVEKNKEVSDTKVGVRTDNRVSDTTIGVKADNKVSDKTIGVKDVNLK
jgi:hypothetical protein